MMTHALALSVMALAFWIPGFSQVQETGESDLEAGEAVYTYWCATCHSPGPGMPGTQALQAKYNGSLPAVLTERRDLTLETISFFVRNGVSVMPPFRKTEITDTDLEALADYVINRSED